MSALKFLEDCWSFVKEMDRVSETNLVNPSELFLNAVEAHKLASIAVGLFLVSKNYIEKLLFECNRALGRITEAMRSMNLEIISGIKDYFSLFLEFIIGLIFLSVVFSVGLCSAFFAVTMHVIDKVSEFARPDFISFFWSAWGTANSSTTVNVNNIQQSLRANNIDDNSSYGYALCINQKITLADSIAYEQAVSGEPVNSVNDIKSEQIIAHMWAITVSRDPRCKNNPQSRPQLRI